MADDELTVAGIVHVRHFGDWCERRPDGLLAWVDGQHLLDEIERLQGLIDTYAAARAAVSNHCYSLDAPEWHTTAQALHAAQEALVAAAGTADD